HRHSPVVDRLATACPGEVFLSPSVSVQPRLFAVARFHRVSSRPARRDGAARFAIRQPLGDCLYHWRPSRSYPRIVPADLIAPGGCRTNAAPELGRSAVIVI